MWDDNQDKQVMRSQMIAVILLTVLFLLWINWFMPVTPPVDDVAEEPRPEEPAPEDPGVPGAPLPEPAEPVDDEWPYLPPVAADEDDDLIFIENGHLRLGLTPVGARLRQAEVLLGREGEHTVQLVPQAPEQPDASAVYPLGVEFTDDAIGGELDRRLWELTEHGGDYAVFTLTLPDVARIHKTFELGGAPHVVTVHVGYENLEEEPREWGIDDRPSFILSWEPNIDAEELGMVGMGLGESLMWRQEGEVESISTANISTSAGAIGGVKFLRDPDWLAVKSGYFLVAFRPLEYPARGWAAGQDDYYRFGVAAPRFQAGPGETHTESFEVYVGPSEMNALAAAWDTLPEAIRFFESDWLTVMDWFAKVLLSLLNWFHGLIPNYGVAIILLTVLVRLAMFPLTYKQVKSMRKMQALAPEMEEIKKKYGEDPQEMQRQMMSLYRERGVNPLAGCLPLLLQMPIFIALYRMLYTTFELRGAPFAFWVQDLSQPDRLAHLSFLADAPLISHFEYLNVLPILCAVSMLASMRLMPQSAAAMQNPQQKMIMTLMPVVFSVICYNFSSGLQLYILTSTVLGIAQTFLIRPGSVDVTPQKKPAAKPKKKHFYDAAQAKKRQMAKENRRVSTSGVNPGKKRARKKPSR